MPASRIDLENAAQTLEAMLDRLTPIRTGSDWRDFERAHRIRKAELAEIAETLREEFSARVKIDAITSRMSMLGVSTTCTAGGEGLFRAWIRAARRVAEALIEEDVE